MSINSCTPVLVGAKDLVQINVALFIVSTTLAFIAVFLLYTEWFSMGGFIAIGAAAIIFIKVIQKVKEQTSKEKAIEQEAKAAEREMLDRGKELLSPFEPDPNQTPTAADQWKKD